jgi:hypothetical protein
LINTLGPAIPVARSSLLSSTLALALIFGIIIPAMPMLMPMPTDAQLPSIPYLPNENDTLGAGGESSLSSDFSAPVDDIPPPTVQITSLQEGQKVPIGELIVEGIGSDNSESDCQVYADVNDTFQ